MADIYLDIIHERDLHELLDTDGDGLRKLIKRRKFPAPSDNNNQGQAYWSKAAVRDWLAAPPKEHPRHTLRLDWWSTTGRPAAYLGATRRYGRGGAKPLAVTQTWLVDDDYVVFAWPMPGSSISVSFRRLREWEPGATAYVKQGADWGIDGPALWAATGSHKDVDGAEIDYNDLARVLGQPAPFWPARLRIPELILAWKPGDAIVRHPGASELDTAPLLRLASSYPCEHPAHRALLHYAQLVHHQSDASKCLDLKLVRQRITPDSRVTPDHLQLAADGVPDEAAAEAELDETTRRAGWLEVLERDDVLAEQCVRAVTMWDGGEALPHSHTVRLEPSRHRDEFLARVEPLTRRTAVFAVLDPYREGRAMRDPLSDAPVVIPDNDEDFPEAAAPNRLLTTRPLAELILDEPIWIRTDDGTLYIAPHDSYFGLSWGYGGTGPATLAALVNKLLHDITAKGADPGRDAQPDGLVELFAKSWPRGTVFTRTQLDAASLGQLPPDPNRG